MASVKGSLTGDMGLISAVTLASRVVGFLRYLVFGIFVGGGAVGTVYASVNLLPNILFEVLAGGALSAAIIPVLARLLEANKNIDANGYLSALLTWMLLTLLPCSLVLYAYAEPTARLVLGTDAGATALGASLLRIFAWQLPLYGISVVLAAFLQCQQRFFWPALVPLLSSVTVMLSYLGYAYTAGDSPAPQTLNETSRAWLGLGTTAGVAMLALPLLRPVKKAGFRYRPTLKFPVDTAPRTLRLAGAGVGAVTAQQLAMLCLLLFAMRAGGPSTLPVFQYANAVYLLPFAVVVIPVITAIFPRLAKMHATSDTRGLDRLSGIGLRLVVFVSAFSSACLWASAPAVEEFFQQIDRDGVRGVGPTLAALSLGLVGWSLTVYGTRLFSALHAWGKAFIIGAFGWLLAAAGIIALSVLSAGSTPAETSTGFALSLAFGLTVSGTIAYSEIQEHVASTGTALENTRTLIVSLLSGALAGMVGWGITRLLLFPGVGIFMTITIGALGATVAAIICLCGLAAFDRTLLREAKRFKRKEA
ncbi:murein biosynthesis integral membrane protein MurJ [Dermabacteraceae bacterium P13264]